MDHNVVERLTEQYGGDWALQHARRLVQLVSIIGKRTPHDREAIWLAAHMHDWGACPEFAEEGHQHSAVSRDLAGAFLREHQCEPAQLERILEAIEFHHGGCEDRCAEAVLLSDADALDSLGAIGVLKEFAMLPAEPYGDYCIPMRLGLRDAYETAQMRMENNFARLKLPASRKLGEKRVREMRRLLKKLEEESFGAF